MWPPEHTVDLIAHAIEGQGDCPEVPAGTEPGVCALIGAERARCLPRADLLGKSFTAGAVLAAPGSKHVSVEAWLALRYKWERMSAWRCDGETFERLDRAGVREAVLHPWSGRPWAGFATTSYKKHGAIVAPINHGTRNVWGWDDERVDCSDSGVVAETWVLLNAALDMGLPRSVLETLDCPQHIMREAGIASWLRVETWARPRYRSALYRFLCYLLPSREERNAR